MTTLVLLRRWKDGEAVWINPDHVVQITSASPEALDHGEVYAWVVLTNDALAIDGSATEVVRALRNAGQ